MTKTGPQDMVVHLPKYYVDAKELAIKRAQERNVPSEELLRKMKNLGVKSFSVFYETDVVKEGARAITELLERNNLDLEDISAIYVATESSIDEAKPLGTDILGELGKNGYRNENIGIIEFKFACVSGSYAIQFACNYVRLHPNKKVIVLCVDEAIYDVGSRAEATQGAGAIAILITANPALVTLDFSKVGILTIDGTGYRRPTGKKTPEVTRDSIYEYLYCMRGAWDHYKLQEENEWPWKNLPRLILGRSILNTLRWWLFHNPYGLMPKDFVSLLLIHEYRLSKEWPGIIEEMKRISGKKEMKEPVGSGVEAYFNEETREQHSKFRALFRKLPLFTEFFEQRVGPSVIASEKTGNLYTGSLFLQLASLMTYGKPRKGDKIGFWGFGSGAGSLFYTGTLESKPNFNLEEKLKNRKKLSIEEYELWRNSLHPQKEK